MASKKPNIKVPPIGDALRQIIKAAIKNSPKAKSKVSKKILADIEKSVRNAAPKRSGAYGGLTAAQRYDIRKAKGMFLDKETRQTGIGQMVKEYDSRLKFDEVNQRMGNKDSAFLGRREMEGRPVTKKQIRDAQGKSKGSKKNLPKKAQKDAKSEGQAIQDAADRAKRKADYKASGGRNSPANIAKRQQKRAAMRDKNKRR